MTDTLKRKNLAALLPKLNEDDVAIILWSLGYMYTPSKAELMIIDAAKVLRKLKYNTFVSWDKKRQELVKKLEEHLSD